MANWNEAIDDKLQWHDFINPVGMGSYLFHKGKNIVSGFSSSAYDVSSDPDYWKRVFDSMGETMKYNSEQAQIDRDFNAAEAQKQRDYETEMSNTAYQRAAADMRAAGLNPYAVYGGASAAAVPTGSAASAGSGARISGGSTLAEKLITSAFSLAGSVSNGILGKIGF